MNFCETYRSNLSQSSGPWNGGLCSSELGKIHCQTGEIKECLPLVFEDSKDSFFACCIKKIRDLKGTILCSACADECTYKCIKKNQNTLHNSISSVFTTFNCQSNQKHRL